jgi:protein SCO1/2
MRASRDAGHLDRAPHLALLGHRGASARVATPGNGGRRYGDGVRRAPLLLSLLVVAGCGSSAAKMETAPAAATTTSTFAGAALATPRPAPPIALRDADGARVTLAGQRGRYVLVTFLYTHCPDVCPLIASNLNTALRTLGPQADVTVLAVSVDPKGDTPAAVRSFAREKRLVPRFRYLIGSRAELKRVWTAWHVLAVQQKPDVVDHVAYTALVDPRGRERVLYDAQIRATQVVHDVRALERG